MDFTNMSMDELKELAKSYNIKLGNIGKEKLIEKITEAQSVAATADDDVVVPEAGTVDTLKDEVVAKPDTRSTNDVLDSIMNAIDDLDETNTAPIDPSIANLPQNTPIVVRSATYGEVIYVSKRNNAVFKWKDFGSEITMSLEQIIEMNNSSANFLRKPRVILCDPRAVEYFRLGDIYNDVALLNNFKQWMKLDNTTFAKMIDSMLAVNLRDALISKARTMYQKGILTDIYKIKILSEKLKFDFIG